jgi:hypothetical protein
MSRRASRRRSPKTSSRSSVTPDRLQQADNRDAVRQYQKIAVLLSMAPADADVVDLETFVPVGAPLLLQPADAASPDVGPTDAARDRIAQNVVTARFAFQCHVPVIRSG